MTEMDFLTLTGLQDANGLVSTVNGEACLSMPGVMLLALSAMHDEDATDDCRAKAMATVEKLLSGARCRGFGKADILLTLVADGERTPRVVELVREAMAGVTPEEVASAMCARIKA